MAPLVGDGAVGAEDEALDRAKMAALDRPREARAEGGQTVGMAEGGRAGDQRAGIDEIGRRQRVGQVGPALAAEAGDAAFGEEGQGAPQVDAAGGVGRDAGHLDPEGRQRAPGMGGRGAGGDHEGRHVVGRPHQRARRLQAQVRIQDDAQRRAPRQARQPHGEGGVVGARRSDAHHDGVRMHPPQMHGPVRDGAGDAQAIPGGARREAILGAGELEAHRRAPLGDAQDMAEMIARRFRAEHPGRQCEAGGLDQAMAAPGDAGIRIRDRRHDPREPRGDDRVGAGRRAAVMRAGLQGDVERRAARRRAGHRQGLGLGMRPAARRRRALADDALLPGRPRHHDGADGGVRPGAPEIAPPERQGQAHEAGLIAHGRPRALRRGAASGLAWPGAGPRVPSRSSKSLASRKFL